MRENEIPLGKAKDLSINKYGKLQPLYRIKSNTKETKWHCLCECGNECNVFAPNLVNGHTKSCGCEKTELHKHIHNKIQNNQKFGMLTALYPTDKRENGKVLWHCLCDCGALLDVRSTSLTSGNTQSCGCMNSKGEMVISKLLQKYNIPFELHKTFDTCRFPDSQHLAFFDFFVYNKYIIEFDGRQHIYGWENDHQNLEYQQKHDNYKTQWCKDNNIPLIRIPYTQLSIISVDDILLERSKFVCQ